MQQCCVVDGLGVYQLYGPHQCKRVEEPWTNLIDTTDPETKRTPFDAGAVHVITNQENKLQRSRRISGVGGDPHSVVP